MNEKYTKLLQVAKETKDALFGEWKKKRYFDDCNNFMNAGSGVFSEAMGLTSIMLLYVCFAEKKEVFENGLNDSETLDIVNTSLDYIYNTVRNDGYIITPLRTAEETKGVIDKNNAYVDTLTWVLSSSTLIIYALRKGFLSVSADVENKAIELISDSLARLINGQLESGAWGFSTNPDAKESLYFTYASAASIADFLDYVLGELEYYSSDDNQVKDPTAFYDWQTVNAINNFYKENPNDIYPKIDITEAVAAAKSKLQMWLLRNCLPILPKIAECTSLTNDEADIIGVAHQSQKSSSNKEYINLYYAYYIIDILTTSSSDKRYQNIVAGEDEVTLDELAQELKKIMPDADYRYFFEKDYGINKNEMFNGYVNQAIHSARTNFSSAMRTGKAFWEGQHGESELDIVWSCYGRSLSEQRIEDARGDVPFKEPTLVPMSLRANTVYCFYIIERADVTVDNLFDMICNDRSDVSETVKKNTTIKNLWDRTNFSLPITERAIEALVDYYDYLTDIANDSVQTFSQTSALSVDEAVEKLIEKYLSSDAGSRLLDEKGYVRKNEIPAGNIDEKAVSELVDRRVNDIVGKKLDELLADKLSAHIPEVDALEKSSNADFDADMYIEELENVQRFVFAHESRPERDSKDYCERLAYAFLETHKLMSKKAFLDSLADVVGDDEAQKKYEGLVEQFKELLSLLTKNYDTSNGNVAAIYRYLMSLR